MIQAKLHQQLFDTGLSFCLGEPVHPSGKAQELEPREFAVQVGPIRYIAKLGLGPHGVFPCIHSAYQCPAPAGAQQAYQVPNSGTFSSAVGAQQGQGLTRANREMQPVQGHKFAVPLAEVFEQSHPHRSKPKAKSYG